MTLAGRRVAVAGFSHETNTFADAVTGLTQEHEFKPQLWGDALVAHHQDAGTGTGGFLQCCAELGWEAVPTFWTFAQPSGTIAASAYESLKKKLIDSIAAALPVDAVALDIHGAGVSETTEDIETDIGRAVRDLVGPDVPVVTALDLHGLSVGATAPLSSPSDGLPPSLQGATIHTRVRCGPEPARYMLFCPRHAVGCRQHLRRDARRL